MRIFRLALASTLTLVAAACSDGTGTSALLTDEEITADIAASSGEAIAAAVDGLLLNQLSAALPYVAGADPQIAHNVTYQRSRKCLDSAGAEVANCSPMASVRRIITTASLSGSRSGSRTRRGDNATVDWSGAVHRTLLDTLTRTFNTAQPPAETSRSHSGTIIGNDTTTFSDGTVTRVAAESAVDSIRAIVFNLPRANNPWPASGSVVRNTSVKLTLTRGDDTDTRTLSRRIQVTFPADAQGNVALQINDTNCTLNLVTRRVTGCE